MLAFIVILLAGSLLVYIAKYNLALVSIHVGQYVFSGIPLFYVIVGSFLSGLIICYTLHLIQAITSYWTLKRRDKEIKKSKEEILELTKRVHQLELECEKLKHNSGMEPEDPNAL